ncbi:MAG: glycoside hydrolase family 5 protein [Lachnospiraceae bacterium]|nr:glycoside hydrolase family 5 protein [Lachnospiraceae bacterium]
MKKFRMRLLSMLVMIVLVFSVVACGKDDAAADKPGTEQDATNTGDNAQDTAGDDVNENQSTEKIEHLSKNGITTYDHGVVRKDLTALEVTKLMGNGINLGNTMEAYGRSEYGVGADVSSYETFWGQPITTQEMITSMKEAGFTALRIPIAWTNAMNFESGDYTIGEDYLNRVEEIINYALNEDMYVIINDHWDGGWWGMFGSASEETRNAAMELYTSMWKQIAERYAEYSDYLIFESANEELGNRLNDTDIAKDSGTLDKDQCYETLHKINQAFVDTVRGTGGNNAYRFLLIAGSDTNINDTCDNRYIMPTDTVEDKLLVSVHYYDPSGYCMQTALASWGNEDQYDEMNNMLRKMSMFTAQGYGVVIGEYGAFPQDGKLKEGAMEYYTNFLANCDQYNFVPMLWDTNNLFKKDGTGFWDEELAQLYLDHSYAAQADISDADLVAASKATKEDLKAHATGAYSLPEDECMAWIMYTSGDWGIQHSVGDIYDPTQSSVGVVATDVPITGAGTYTVALDFTGTGAGYANGLTFSAIGIDNGEANFPGYYIDITKIVINGQEVNMTAKAFTTSDDQSCTRVNLYNAWVTKVPDSARCLDGDVSAVSPCIIDVNVGNVETLEVTFDYVAP